MKYILAVIIGVILADALPPHAGWFWTIVAIILVCGLLGVLL